MNDGKGDNTERRLPGWLKRPVGSGSTYQQVLEVLADLQLATVCGSAGCPNQGECFSQGTATFMILGEICTRSCKFCAVKSGKPLPVDEDEPFRLAPLTTVRPPDGLDEKAFRADLLAEHGIEIGGGLGPLAGQVVRIGLMGTSSTRENLLRFLEATERLTGVTGGPGVQAAEKALD